MANGKQFSDDNKIAASWDYSFGTKLKVTCVRTGRSTIVEVMDRGPSKKLYKKGRVLDLSKSAFAEIAPLKWGIIEVRIEKI